MNRMFAALAVLLAAGAAAQADDKPPVRIIWHAQSFFEIISNQGTRVVIDPHAIDAFGRIEVKDVDLILMSHLHSDHTQVDVVDNYRKVPTYNALKDVKGDGRRIEFNPVNDSIKDVKFRDVPVYHDNAQGMIRGRNGVWVLEMDGLHIVHLGDLGHLLTDEQLKQIGPVDVLMIPVGGVYTLNGTDAKKVIEQLHPKRYVIPMHYGIPHKYEDLLPLDEFLDGLKPEVVKRFDTTNELTVDPAADPPGEALIAILNWTKK